MSLNKTALQAPFVWFGGKRRVAPEIWDAIGDVDHYVEPFAGSLAVLLGRPERHRRRAETVNDADAYLANFWRAISADPEAVAAYADWPVNETDLFARHLWLVNTGRERLAKMEADPEFFDAKVAGWWVWGINAWIGSGWCSGDGPWKPADAGAASEAGNAGQGVNRQLPHLGNAGQGVNRQLPHLGDAGQGVEPAASPPRGRGPGRRTGSFPTSGTRGGASYRLLCRPGRPAGSRPGVLRRLVPCAHQRRARLRVHGRRVPRPAILRRSLHYRAIHQRSRGHQCGRAGMGGHARGRPPVPDSPRRLRAGARGAYACRLAGARLHQEPGLRHVGVGDDGRERLQPAQRAAVVLPSLPGRQAVPVRPGGRMTTLAQLPLFGSQPVHLGRADRICAMCKVSIPFAAIWGADCCPGFTASVPAGMVLPGDGPLGMEAAA